MSAAHQPDDTSASSAVYKADNTTASTSFLANIKNQVTLFYFWWHVIIVPVGIVGNVLCFLVMSQKRNRLISCGAYMRALAVADTVHMITPAVYSVLFTRVTNLIQETASITLVCKAMTYCSFTSGQCGVLIILAILVKRVIVVRKPMKAAPLLSTKRAFIITFTIAVFASLFNIPVIFITSATKVASTVECANNAMGRSRVGYTIYSISMLFFNGALPLVGILVMNLMIFFKIKSSKNAFGKPRKTKKCYKQTKEIITAASGSVDISKITDDIVIPGGDIKLDFLDHAVAATSTSESETRHSQLQSVATNIDTETSAPRSHSQRNQQLIIMTVTMTLVFLFLAMPKFVFILTFRSINFQSSATQQIVFAVSTQIALSLVTSNSTINFYIYTLTGSKFRADFKKLFWCTRADTC